jgi:polyisoprenoid-binding protein YceI
MWEDYLKVGKFPEIRFILTGLADLRKDAGVVGVTLEGEIALHGVTKDLRIPATVILGDRGLEVKGKTTLKMSDYAIERPSFLFIKDEVDVRFRVVVGETE